MAFDAWFEFDIIDNFAVASPKCQIDAGLGTAASMILGRIQQHSCADPQSMDRRRCEEKWSDAHFSRLHLD